MNHLKLRDTLTDHSGRIWCVAWSNDGKYIASGGEDKILRIWSYDPITCRWNAFISNQGHLGTIRCIKWSPSDKYLATCGFDAQIIIWNIEKDDLIETETLELHKSEIKSVAWSYSGDYLASCGRDKAVNIYDTNEDFEILESPVEIHTEDVKCVNWHPKENILVSCGFDNSIAVVKQNVDEWDLSVSFNAHEHIVRSVGFNYTGVILASCSDDSTVKLWISKDNSYVDWICINTLSGYHTNAIWDLSWCNNKNLIATCGRDNGICVFDVEEIDCEFGFSKALDCGSLAVKLVASEKEAHNEDVNSICWNETGRLLVTGSDDWSIKVWSYVDYDDMPID